MPVRRPSHLVACLLLVGCVPDLSPWQIERSASSRDSGIGEGACTRTLYGNAIRGSSSGCYFDAQISGTTGTLEHACEGGAARAVFGDHVFLGTVTDGFVDLTLSTRYPYAGCDWDTQQRIRGSLDSGALDYRYGEAPAPGQSGCSSACTGTATIEVR